MATRRQVLATILKLGISALALGYACFQVWQDREELRDMLDGLGAPQVLLILLVLLMVAPNIWLEALKWRTMVQPFYPQLGRWTATKAVLAGMASGVFTPNRVGEYAGRVLYLPEGHRVEAILATFIDRICQLLVTILGGLLALSGLLLGTSVQLSGSVFVQPWQYNTFLALAGLTAVLILVFLLRPTLLVAIIPASWQRYSWVRKLRFAAERVDRGRLMQVMGWSVLRYAVFSTQYYLLLLAFGFEGSALLGYGMIALVFLAKNAFPVLGVMELGVREVIAIQLMGLYGFGSAGAFNSTLLLYFINIIFPTLVGVFFLQGLKLEGDEA